MKINMGNTALNKTETQNGKRMSSVANVVCEAVEGGGRGGRGWEGGRSIEQQMFSHPQLSD